MPTAHEVRQQIRSIGGGDRFLGHREIGQLPKILMGDERIGHLVAGRYEGHWGIMVATNRRLLFVDKGVFRLRVEEFAYDKVSSIQYKTGVFFGTITIFASGNKAEVRDIDKGAIQPFVDVTRGFMSGGPVNSEAVPTQILSTAPTTHSPETSATSPATEDERLSRLERLGRLRDQGVLTEDEFLEQKRSILSS